MKRKLIDSLPLWLGSPPGQRMTQYCSTVETCPECATTSRWQSLVCGNVCVHSKVSFVPAAKLTYCSCCCQLGFIKGEGPTFTTRWFTSLPLLHEDEGIGWWRGVVVIEPAFSHLRNDGHVVLLWCRGGPLLLLLVVDTLKWLCLYRREEFSEPQ